MQEMQQDVCALCGVDAPGGKSDVWHADHDHACCLTLTNSCGLCLRALLCVRCNLALGKFHDDPDLLRRAADYVEFWRRAAPTSLDEHLEALREWTIKG